MLTPLQKSVLKVAGSCVVIVFAGVGVVHALPHIHAGLTNRLVSGGPGAFASARYIVTVTNETGGTIDLRLLLLNPPPEGERTPLGSYYEQVLGYRSDATFRLARGETRVVDLPLTSRVPHPVMVAAVQSPRAFALVPVDLVRGTELVPEGYPVPGRVTAAAVVRVTPEYWVELPIPQGDAYGSGPAAPVLREALEKFQAAD